MGPGRVRRAQGEQATGYIAVNDMLSIGLLAGLRDAGLQVPAQVSVVGTDAVAHILAS